MLDLLKAMRARLRDQLADVRDQDVYVTPALDLARPGTMWPAVSLKDGGVERVELAGGYVDETLRVHCGCMVQVADTEAAILGDASRAGVLDLSARVRAALNDEFLGLPGVVRAWCERDYESAPIVDRNVMIQVQALTFVYQREVTR